MVQFVYVDKNGIQIPSGQRVKVDNCIDTFTVQVRSLGGVGAFGIKQLLQDKFEVCDVNHTERFIIAERF